MPYKLTDQPTIDNLFNLIYSSITETKQFNKSSSSVEMLSVRQNYELAPFFR